MCSEAAPGARPLFQFELVGWLSRAAAIDRDDFHRIVNLGCLDEADGARRGSDRLPHLRAGAEHLGMFAGTAVDRTVGVPPSVDEMQVEVGLDRKSVV